MPSAPDVATAFAHADVCIVNDDWPQWRTLTAKDLAGMRRKFVVAGRRILRGEVMQGIQLSVLGGYVELPLGRSPVSLDVASPAWPEAPLERESARARLHSGLGENP